MRGSARKQSMLKQRSQTNDQKDLGMVKGRENQVVKDKWLSEVSL
jgi:hypothetical protein